MACDSGAAEPEAEGLTQRDPADGDVQAGYGTSGGFGQLSFIKQFDFIESGSFF